MRTFGDLFTARQLVALTTFSDLVEEARERVKRDALAAGLDDDGKRLETVARRHGLRGCGGAVSRVARQQSWLTTVNRLCDWRTDDSTLEYFRSPSDPDGLGLRRSEPFGMPVGSFGDCFDGVAKVARQVRFSDGCGIGRKRMPPQTMTQSTRSSRTDPPYYDNIGYADLSDFFYVWLRRSLKPVFRTSSQRSPCPRRRNSWLRPIATAARRRRRHSS